MEACEAVPCDCSTGTLDLVYSVLKKQVATGSKKSSSVRERGKKLKQEKPSYNDCMDQQHKVTRNAANQSRAGEEMSRSESDSDYAAESGLEGHSESSEEAEEFVNGTKMSLV